MSRAQVNARHGLEALCGAVSSVGVSDVIIAEALESFQHHARTLVAYSAVSRGVN